MKKIKFEGKLDLKKETITNLNGFQMGGLHGGGPTGNAGTNPGGGGSWVQTVCTNMSTIGTCYSMGVTCLPDSASCNVNSCPQASCANC